MTGRDLIGLGIVYAYAFILIGVVEGIRRLLRYPQDFTRKLVHIGAGMCVFIVLSAFDNWYVGIIPFATFIVLNFIFYRYRLLDSVDNEDSTPGTIYFAISITILFAWLWRTNNHADRGYVAAAGTMAMTWGDALASIIGRRWGRHRYTFRGDTRSLEGSATMLIASLVTMFLTLRLVPGSPLSPYTQPFNLSTCVTAALIGSILATIAEGISPRGKDNLSVPLLSAGVIFAVTSLI